MGVLNFSTNNLITGVNVIDGNLYWTDNLNEPKKLEIDRFRDYTQVENTAIRGEFFNESDISVIRPHPHVSINLELEEYVSTAAQPDPPFEEIFPRFSYRWRYEDGQYSPFAPFTQAAFIPETRSLTGLPDWDERTGYFAEDTFNDIQASEVNFESRAYRAIVNIDIPAIGEPDNDPPENNTTQWEDIGIAQRTTEQSNYIEGFNTTMFNNVGTITLNDIPRGPRDVVAVELLYTESISSTVYVLETLDIPEAQRGLDYVLSGSYVSGMPTDNDYDLLPLSYELSARKIYSALPANQLTRPYDEVPQRAKAQEITANRLIYGNYQIGFNQPEPLALTSTLESAGTGDGLHVKGNRTYEIGVAYIDPYGRQGSMVQAGSITADDGTVTEQIPLVSAFSQSSRQQIETTITSAAPPWADTYRYFIKDPSMDHHSLISYNIYNDGGAIDNRSEFVWIEFQSTDRNKVQAEDQTNQGTILTLRRENDNIQTIKQRFLVQDIQNEAPEDVRMQLREVLSNVSLTRAGSFSDDTPIGNRYNGPNSDVTTARGNFGSGSTTLSIDAGGNTSATREAFAAAVVNPLNSIVNRLQPETQAERVDEIDTLGGGNTTPAIDVTFENLTSPIYIRIRTGQNPDTYLGGEFTYVQVLGAGNGWFQGATAPGNSRGRGIYLTLGGQFTADIEGEGLTRVVNNLGESTEGLPAALSGDYTVEFYTSRISDTAIERLGGRFWVRTARNGLTTQQSEFTFDGLLTSLNQHWFETEPIVAESQLDLFWESSDTFCVATEHGWPNRINWFNCVAEATTDGVYLESTRTFDKFNSVQLVKGVRVNTPTDRNEVIERPYGLTWSGIYNSRTSVNRLNEFITADGITKELEPNYGSLQKLHTRDTNIIAFCEDKIFRILADKDQLFNADGGGNVSATNAVLGQTTPFVGEYGISKNPESFASYGHNIYCSDAKRGVVLQITPGNGQIFEISNSGLNDFFRDRLFSSDRIIGMFDDYSDKYVISVQGYDGTDAIIDPLDMLPEEGTTSDNVTWGYEIRSEGWPSRMSFIPEDGLTLNNRFFTWKNGQLYMHNSNTVDRNVFYGEDAVPSEIEVVFNDNPSAVKEFLTLGYEGTPDWTVMSIDTENSNEIAWSSDMDNFPFLVKENKYFKPIVTQEEILQFNAAGDGLEGSGNFREKSGVKGFYNVVRLQNASTTSAELFAINTENYISSN